MIFNLPLWLRKACLICSGGFFCFHAAQAEVILMGVPASLKMPLQHVLESVRKKYPDLDIKMTSAATGSLLQQLRHGAPLDIFISADQAHMAQAIQDGLVNQSDAAVWLRNTLWLVAPANSSIQLAGLPELRSSAVRRIAIGRPVLVPAGTYAASALQNAALSQTLKQKFIYGDSVTQVLNYVSRREADVGFVYGSDARQGGDRIRPLFRVPTAEPINYYAAVTAESSHPAAARRALRILRSDEAMQILRRFGFLPQAQP